MADSGEHFAFDVASLKSRDTGLPRQQIRSQLGQRITNGTRQCDAGNNDPVLILLERHESSDWDFEAN